MNTSTPSQACKEFSPGDVIEKDGECYQVLTQEGSGGQVRLFPGDEPQGFYLPWEDEAGCARRIGASALPGPSPCATGNPCPTYSAKPPAAASDPGADPSRLIHRQG